jgi:hypothetical protein
MTRRIPKWDQIRSSLVGVRMPMRHADTSIRLPEYLAGVHSSCDLVVESLMLQSHLDDRDWPLPNLLQEAGRLGGRVFNIPQDEWDAMTPDQSWEFNKEFLDEAIVTDQQIILATPPEKVPLGSTLEKELNYLASHGCFPRQVSDHWEVARS